MRKLNQQIHFLTRLLLLCAGCFLLHQADAQQATIWIELSNTNLSAVVNRLQEQVPEIHFSFQPSTFEKIKVDKVSVKAGSLKEALAQLKKQCHLDYLIDGKTVALKYNSAIQSTEKKTATGAGSHTIRGRVVDFETTAPLAGATVQLEGTNKTVVSDDKGFYTLTGIRSGEYTLAVTYTGYAAFTEAIKLNGNETYDVKLQAGSGSTLGEVVISTAGKKVRTVTHTTEKALVAEIRNAQSVVSGISSEQIGKSADRNAAQVAQRVAGVSIVDDKFVIVRGLNQRYNLTYLNDNVAPSTEVNNRNFALDLIPSRIVDKILVYKSPSADNQADATGGVIKIYTKEAKNVKHFDIEFQLGVRPGTTFNKNFLTYNGGKTDLLGFDDGTRRLPSSVPGYGNLALAALSPSQYARTFTNTLSYGKVTALPNLQLTANYYNTFRLRRKALSSLTSFSYKNERQVKDIYRQEGATYVSLLSTDKSGTENSNVNTVQMNLLQNFILRLRDSSSISFKNFLLQQGANTTVMRINYPTAYALGYENTGFFTSYDLNKDIILSYNQRFLYAGNVGGNHYFNQAKHRLQWNLGYNYSRQETPDQRVIRLRGIRNAFAVGDAAIQWYARGYTPASSDDLNTIPLSLGIISRLWSRNSEGVYNGSLDYSFKPNSWITIKAGTFHQWKKRQLARRIYTAHEGNITPEASWFKIIGPGYTDVNLVRFRQQDLGNVWSENYFNDAYTGLYVLDRTSGSDMYVGTEQNNSGYALFSLSPFNWVEVNGGGRFEYNRQKIGAAVPKEAVTFYDINMPVLVDNPTSSWLPSVNVSLKPLNSIVVRLAYGKTVNRTEFREVSPFKELDFENNTVLQGNPNLISAKVANYDFRMEWYPREDKGEMISVGAFYKKIDNPIERMNNSNRVESMFPAISYRNATSATVKGLELEARKLLDFIPGSLFRNLSVIGNASLIYSEARFDNAIATDFIISKRPLQGQAPYILNAGLYYDNAGSGTKASVIYNYLAENIYAAGMGYKSNSFIIGSEYRGSLIELPRQLIDFSFSQRIAKTIQLKFTVQNLLNGKIQMAEDLNGTNKYEPLKEIPATTGGGMYPTYKGDNIGFSYRPGRYFNLSVSYSF